ncbi:unnamed protein product [marine sediment metagenome]|uniref:Uncharacterized protein n=1 Tax=marine sediment metagenome TaxID=412755 RepID=X1MZS7_9ZZZZ
MPVYSIEEYKELLAKYNRLYRFIFEVAERFAEIKDDKESVGEMLESWLKEELK